MKIEIKRTNGKWLINGKPYNKTNGDERLFFSEFINYMKYQLDIEVVDPQIVKP